MRAGGLMERVRIATRGSALALAQSKQVAAALEERTGVRTELVVLRTSGEQVQDVFRISKSTAHGINAQNELQSLAPAASFSAPGRAGLCGVQQSRHTGAQLAPNLSAAMSLAILPGCGNKREAAADRSGV